MSPASCGNLVTPRPLIRGPCDPCFTTFPHDITHTNTHTHTHTHTHARTHTHTHTHTQRNSLHAVLYTYSQIATLYRVSSSKGCRVHELQCNMCGHSNTFVFASIANSWFAINHSISPTFPPHTALWRRVPSSCKRSGHVSVTHIPLHKELQHTLHTHLPHISRGECLFCSTQQILTYSTCTPHQSIHM